MTTGYLRACSKCGRPFEPEKPHYVECRACYEFVPPPTRKQGGFLVGLSYLLRVPTPEARTPWEAWEATEELLALAGANPNIAECNEPGCSWLVDVRRNTRCRRHRARRTA